jgi:hypothetical protein
MVDATDLKSVLAKSGVWVRLPSSAPLKIPILLGNLLGLSNFIDCERSRTKTHENTVYLPSISQVNSIDFESNWRRRQRDQWIVTDALYRADRYRAVARDGL